MRACTCSRVVCADAVLSTLSVKTHPANRRTALPFRHHSDLPDRVGATQGTNNLVPGIQFLPPAAALIALAAVGSLAFVPAAAEVPPPVVTSAALAAPPAAEIA